jgi:hypothetical protein
MYLLCVNSVLSILHASQAIGDGGDGGTEDDAPEAAFLPHRSLPSLRPLHLLLPALCRPLLFVRDLANKGPVLVRLPASVSSQRRSRGNGALLVVSYLHILSVVAVFRLASQVNRPFVTKIRIYEV